MPCTLPARCQGSPAEDTHGDQKRGPGTEESMQYQIPVFTFHGPSVFFAIFPHHPGQDVVDKTMMNTCAEEPKPFKKSGTTIPFSMENPLPKPWFMR